MRIYFTGSVAAKTTYLSEYLRIISYVESLGHTVIAHHITHTSESDIKEQSRDEIISFQQRVEKWIRECDLMIADTSFPSVSVGYEIALALKMSKSILVFYGEGGAPSLLSYSKDENLISERFTDGMYKDTISNFITFVNSKPEQRYTLSLPASLAIYLDEIVKQENMPKAVYIRKLIENDMKNHEF